QLFEYHREGAVIHLCAAILLRYVQSEQAHLLHLGHERIRVLIAPLHGRGNGNDILIDELSHRVDDQLALAGHRRGATNLCFILRTPSPFWFTPRDSTVTMLPSSLLRMVDSA